ncbi:MAG TPA: GTP-binding protein [Stellaceae bacterium]|nr:GTP-binding protein [Stellaceae bacterium]
MEDTPAHETLPTTVLTGFLGSGKTTLLRRALADPRFTDTAVIVNEVGAVAIDHYLVDFVEGGVLELPGGCLCCAVREDVARTLRDLIDRRDAGSVRPFRRIVIETSGLADPAPILYTLGADAMLDARLSLGRVVTVVDAQNGGETLARFAEAARQAAMADALVMSKTDLAAVGDELSMALAALNPDAERVVGREISDPGLVLFSPHLNPPSLAGEGDDEHQRFKRASPAGERGSGQGPQAVHSHGIDSFTLILSGKMNRLDFAKALGTLAAACGSDLLRVKGLVAFADRDNQPALVQGAQHTMFAPEWLDGWPDSDHRSRLVFVVHEIPRETVLASFAFAAPTLIGPQASRLHAGGTPAFH